MNRDPLLELMEASSKQPLEPTREQWFKQQRKHDWTNSRVLLWMYTLARYIPIVVLTGTTSAYLGFIFTKVMFH